MIYKKLTRLTFKDKLSYDQTRDYRDYCNYQAIPADSGHNPVGWLMVLFTWVLFVGLAVTGFMMEEIDMFFGNSLLESIHSIFFKRIIRHYHRAYFSGIRCWMVGKNFLSWCDDYR
jgi:cytochrome b